jgi:hypothetical protein
VDTSAGGNGVFPLTLKRLPRWLTLTEEVYLGFGYQGPYKVTKGLPLYPRSPSQWPKLLRSLLTGHSSWRPQDFRKAERDNTTLRKMLAKLCQEVSESWVRLLPITLFRVKIAPKANLCLYAFDMTYGRLFLTFVTNGSRNPSSDECSST